ncbi:nucleotidyltransferase [Chitinophaga polysaccharea]|uniref:nucleotidyltransferase n=1 Tax=Chitinophaga polysaccharea TaxID=1293035 RepID=UPI001158373B|nr:nucleotidyltransferase [Chitinophaga polysaccharea]
MILAKDFEDFIRLLNKHEVEYMVVGGYAMAFHGRPRFTGDLDIWINISERNAANLLKVIKDFGFSSLGFKKADFLQEGCITQIGYPPLRIDLLNSIDGVRFPEAYENRQKMIEDDLEVCFIGRQDLLANKMASGRDVDLLDVRELKKITPQKSQQPKKGKGRKH